MKPLNLSQCIRMTFAHDVDPSTPISLDKSATEKLGHIPVLLRALAHCYGPRLGEPTLWGGEIHIEINSDEELFDVTESVANVLATSARELEANAQRKPPLMLTEAVTNIHSIDLLRALAKTYDKSQLTASLHVADKTIELPHPKLSVFTEPDTKKNDKTHIRANVIGVCIPKADANVVLLGDMTLLELPAADYAQDIDDIFEQVMKCSATFIGPAKLVSKGVYRALAGGKLQIQMSL